MKIRIAEREQEFQYIYSNFHEKIYRYLSRLISENEAEDVMQEVFLKVNASLATFRGESSLSTWIYRIATNAATDHLRKARGSQPERTVDEHADREPILIEDDTAVDWNVLLPDAQFIRKEMNHCIRSIAESLPENYRTMLILSDFEELTNNQIAEVLGLSLDTVKIRLHRARMRLRRELESKCDFYHDERNELSCDKKHVSLKLVSK